MGGLPALASAPALSEVSCCLRCRLYLWGPFRKEQQGGWREGRRRPPQVQSGNELHLNEAGRCVPSDAPLPGTPCHSDKAASSSPFSWREGGMAPGKEAGRRDEEGQGKS